MIANNIIDTDADRKGHPSLYVLPIDLKMERYGTYFQFDATKEVIKIAHCIQPVIKLTFLV
jgi:hypothetical protein